MISGTKKRIRKSSRSIQVLYIIHNTSTCLCNSTAIGKPSNVVLVVVTRVPISAATGQIIRSRESRPQNVVHSITLSDREQCPKDGKRNTKTTE